MSISSTGACTLFVESFDRLTAMVRERLDVELRYHKRQDLQRLGDALSEDAVEFGRLLRVVFRYGLVAALPAEASWYAASLRARGPGQDAFSLLLDSWTVAIQGTIKPPECNELADPLQLLRANLPHILELAGARYGTPPAEEIGLIVDRLTAGDVYQAQATVQSLLTAGKRPSSVITDLLLPAMREIGRRWENNELAIFQEHLATETTRRLLAVLPSMASRVASIGRTALISCVPHDEHQLLPLAMGVYLELRGWRVSLLGGSLPASEIARAAAALSPAALFLSFPMLSRLDDALDTVACVRAPAPHCRIIIGGRGTIATRALLEGAGAKVVLDFEEAHHAGVEDVPRA